MLANALIQTRLHVRPKAEQALEPLAISIDSDARAGNTAPLEPTHAAGMLCRKTGPRQLGWRFFSATLVVMIPMLAWVGSGTAQAEPVPGGRIIATGGATSIEGSAGGGIVPWAVLSGYGQDDQSGTAVAATHVNLPDYDLQSFSVARSFNNRVELSFNHQNMDIGVVGPGERLKQKTLGLKVRLAGELIYSALPQISFGLQYKENETFTIPQAVGASDDSGVDAYLAASKLWLAGPFNRTAFVNGTVRATRANQLGLLGFGGDVNDDYEFVGEASAGLFLNRHWVLGAEYRQKPDNLSFATEDDWYDAFVGWFPNKRFSAVAAWSRLGSIAGQDDQDSVYLSVQVSH